MHALRVMMLLAACSAAAAAGDQGRRLSEGDMSQYNRPSSTLGNTPAQLPWIDFTRPADFTCWELGLGQHVQAGDGFAVGQLRPGGTAVFELEFDGTPQQALDLSCLGGGRGTDGSHAIFSPGGGTPNFGMELVATLSRAGADEVAFDLAGAGFLQPRGVTPGVSSGAGSDNGLHTFDAGQPVSSWALRLMNRNKLLKISLDLYIGFAQTAPATPSCEVCDAGACSDCKSCVGLGAAGEGGAPDPRCAACYARTAGAACLATDFSMCESECWTGRAGNAPVVLVNPMTGTSLFGEWDKQEVVSALCSHRSDGLQAIWPPALTQLGALGCTLDNMKLEWDDASQDLADRGITRTVTVPSGAPPGADALTAGKVWPALVDTLQRELGHSSHRR